VREMSVSRTFSTYPESPVKETPSSFPSQLSQRETSIASFINLSKSLVNVLISRFSSGAPMERNALLQSLHNLHPSQSPRYVSPLPGSPTGPLWKEVPVTRSFLYIIFKAPSKGAPPPGSPHRAPIERDPEPSNYQSPVNGPPNNSPFPQSLR